MKLIVLTQSLPQASDWILLVIGTSKEKALLSC